MINLDSEEEGFIECSCAGGLTGTSTLPVKRIDATGKKMKISIAGLQGGHSGMDINKNRTNATKLLARLLFDLREVESFGLIQMQGGYKDNVIPCEAQAELLIEADNKSELSKKYQDIHKNIIELFEEYRQELSTSEPKLSCTLEDMGDTTAAVLHPLSFEKMLFLLIEAPNGVQTMSSDIEGLVESSLNLGIFHTLEDRVEFFNSVRSSKSSSKYFISNKLNYMISFLGGDYIVRSEYPAWEYQKTSALRDHLQKLYHEMIGKDLEIKAIHAGLECGLIYEKIPGIDIVSIGPDIYDVHTIEEKISISSAVRVYQFLERVIEEKIGA
jgi:dipeptidase D